MVKVKISDWKADSSMDEAYKALRTNIQFCGADKKGDCIYKLYPERRKE
ncbi:MAG: hypothetical protein ACLU6Y_12095 [Ruminococcus sp.]